jgi:signal transduction histidine kinase
MRAPSWPSVSPLVGDSVLAAVLAVGAQLELWLAGDGTPVLSAAAVLGTLPLTLRRRFPLGALVGVVASVAVLIVAGTDYLTTVQVLALMLATYSVALHASLARAVTGLVVADGLAVTSSLLGTEAPEVGDVAFPLILLSVPWLAGRALRLWHRRTAELQRLTEELAHEREERAALAVAAERARIARELHDVLMQTVHVIVIHAEAAEEALDHDPARARQPLHKIQQTGREALRETRRMLGLLHEPDEPLAPPPSTSDVASLVELTRSAGLDVSIRIDGTPRRLPPALELSVYRIVQQALTNTLTHAAARNAAVVLRYTADRLEVSVTDDGAGAAAPGGPGYGIAGMQERAAVFGGSLTAGPVAGGGFEVRASLPIERVPA